ncbi:hypothetical protein MBLNU230_g0483t1 [Neophaeotheca triangularis]
MATTTPAPIAVLGSLNIDFITLTPRMPTGGETLTASSFSTGFGGKGANQAVAAARLGGRVQMIGQVGADTFGTDYFNALAGEGIDASGVRKLQGQATGVANIIVEEGKGENRILFCGNANYEFAESNESGGWDLLPQGLGEGSVVVMQLEVPPQVVFRNLRLASERGCHTVFNPAPALPVPEDVYGCISTLVMNESESGILAGEGNKGKSAEELVEYFLGLGVKDAVVITLGSEGLVFATKDGRKGKVGAKKVKVVDTTAAGDTFVGAYAVERAKQQGGEKAFDYEKALEFATLAASKTVERSGAMGAIPKLGEL